ncbi:aminodeoxychorismate lyase [Mangrovimicrobium sediminis]|uniref:Aminodeoxychorismate lyase n=1 Tax=Mangrovimicrobium sediminis TaxID=2562682 RepID=A0A4Z0M2G3_9GAMM|nr:aminodeoxychorismate lyase [Haliea sp. SAOS-164]TGD73646.1 aminodeoxychorismate lyase [Haliea sp. SAOS-164]
MQPPVPSIWVDGEPATALPLPDRGLDFGDGLFETLLLQLGHAHFLDYHLQRLSSGLQRLAFPDCLARCESALRTAAQGLAELPWAALRITVSRGAGPRGYAPPPDATPRIVVTAAPLQQDHRDPPAPLDVAVAQIRWSAQPALAGLKHLNRLEQVIAARQATAAGADDALMLDAAGNVCSLAAANLFIVESGCLYTPPLADCGILGTRRRLVIERLAPACGLSVLEQSLSLQRVQDAEEVFCSNSLRGLQPVGSCDTRRWQDHPVARRLHQAYVDVLARDFDGGTA